MPRFVKRFCFAIVGTLLFAFTGCVSAPEPGQSPSVIQTPRIVWKDGVEPASPLEQNKFVKFLRASLVGEAVAWNSGDFTVEQLVSTSTSNDIEYLVGLYNGQHVVQWKYLGPLPIEPISLKMASGARSAIVTLCVGADAAWQLRTAGIPNDTPQTAAFAVEVRTSRAGRLYVKDGFSPTDGSCAGVQVPVGSFDPPVTVPDDPFAHPIKGVKRAPLQWQIDKLKKTVG